MSLANEAAYLYTYSKKLMSINSQLKKLSKKAEKNLSKHHKTDDYAKKEKQYFKENGVKIENIKATWDDRKSYDTVRPPGIIFDATDVNGLSRNVVFYHKVDKTEKCKKFSFDKMFDFTVHMRLLRTWKNYEDYYLRKKFLENRYALLKKFLIYKEIEEEFNTRYEILLRWWKGK